MADMVTAIVGDYPAPGRAAPVALVTGAAGGMGRAIAQRLARNGMALVLVDRDVDGMIGTAEAVGIRGLAIAADLRRHGSAAEIMALVGDRLGRLDHLVNNAGMNRPGGRTGSIFTIDAGDWEAVMAINLTAPMLLAQQAIPFWRAQGGGTIVSIGSRVWLSGAIPAYTASKAGLVGLTRSLAVELGPLNVRANVVAPSYVDTPFTRLNRTPEDVARAQARIHGITPLPRLATPEDIANAVAYLASEEAGFVTGEVLHVCGGSQLAPQVVPFAHGGL